MAQLQYNPEVFTLDDFATATATQAGDDEFTLVERLDVEEGEGVYVGRGTSTNPLQAEGSIDGDIQNESGNPIDGRYMIAVVNSQNNRVENGTIKRGRIDELRQTRPNSLDGDLTAFVDVEVKEPYQVGLFIRTNSGTEDYSSAKSSIQIDGFLGEALN